MKKAVSVFVLTYMILYFLFEPAQTFEASKAGLLLWFNQVLPTLLPFVILSSILIGSGCMDILLPSKTKCRIRISEWLVILFGTVFGFPIGSKLAADLYHHRLISKSHAQILCTFFNNFSPLFVSSFVCNQQMHHPEWTLPFYFALYLPGFLLGILLLFIGPNEYGDTHKKSASRFQINMQIIDAGILNSFVTLIKLCGYIVMFSILASIIQRMNFLPQALLVLGVGLTEATNGIATLANQSFADPLKAMFAIGILAFSGMSGIAQASSILLPEKLSMKQYVLGRILCCILACVCMAVYLFYFADSA